MLVHKQTMGVLDQFWTGQYETVMDIRVPAMAEYSFENTDLDPSEWWYVPRNSRLGKRLRAVYPHCIPETDENGELSGIRVEVPARVPAPKEEYVPEKKRRQRPRKGGLLGEWLGGTVKMDNTNKWKRGGALSLRTRQFAQILTCALRKGWTR